MTPGSPVGGRAWSFREKLASHVREHVFDIGQRRHLFSLAAGGKCLSHLFAQAMKYFMFERSS